MMDTFEKQLLDYLQQRREQMKQEKNWVFPVGEFFFTRKDKADFAGCGPDSTVFDSAIIMGPVKLGRHVWIGPNTLLEGANDTLTIGDWVSIDAGVLVYTHDTTKRYVCGGKAPTQKAPVTIGDYTVIGSQSMVCCGVTIGKHCVIGANSFINKDIPDYSIAFGTPAKVVGRVEITENDVNFHYFDS
jgi:acetyltransferase-like isoleucine patch superfamily enzyme